MTTSSFQPYQSFRGIREGTPFPRSAWEVNVALHAIERHLEHFCDPSGLDLNPDFQRGHVWTNDQQAAFVEYLVQSGPSARVIYFAADGWPHNSSPVVIVDGKQRLEACRRFMRNELRIFDKLLSEFNDDSKVLGIGSGFRFNVADVNREQTLRWYLALNSGGTPHAESEIENVQRLLFEEVRS